MSDDTFSFAGSGQADEATRAELVADLDVLAEKYRNVLTIQVAHTPAPVVVTLDHPSDEQVAYEAEMAAEGARREAEEAERLDAYAKNRDDQARAFAEEREREDTEAREREESAIVDAGET